MKIFLYMLALSFHARICVYTQTQTRAQKVSVYTKILDGARIGHTPAINRKRRISVVYHCASQATYISKVFFQNFCFL